MTSPALTLVGTNASIIGYGRLAVELRRSLVQQGVRVHDRFTDDGSQVPNIAWDGHDPGLTNLCCWVTFPSHARGWLEGQRVTVFTMFETDHLPEAFHENMQEFDQVVVPSRQNLEMFSEFHPNVAYVPLGVDPTDWHYIPRQDPDRFFWFLCAGAGERKGPDLAVRAFRKVFPHPDRMHPVPQLILKTPRLDDQIKGVWLAGPDIHVLGGRCSAEEEIDLYASIHCYLGPSRGEGFGLQPLQAMAQGIPTILTNAHGHESFAHLGIGLSSTKVQAGYFSLAGEGRSGHWWEPDFDELCAAMRDVYDHYAQHLDDAKTSAATVVADWTWDQTARLFREAVGEDHLTAPYSGSGVWHSPQLKRYEVRVSRPYAGQAAGVYLQMDPGVTYWQVADVKRQLFEAGYLDPSCLGETAAEPGMFVDTGLTEDQVSRIGGYRAEHGHCRMCGQPLNSMPTKADGIYAELEQLDQGLVIDADGHAYLSQKKPA